MPATPPGAVETVRRSMSAPAFAERYRSQQKKGGYFTLSAPSCAASGEGGR